MNYPQTIKELKEGLKSKTFTSVELVEYYYDQIEKHNEALGAFLWLDKEYALAQAKQADERGYEEDSPLLNGIPVAVKDNILTKQFKTTAASKMLENFVSTFDATVVAQLEQAGAVILGKTNMDEFAMGPANETSYFYPAHNPWNTAHTPGGSSGGSAAAVSGRLAPAALGTDTGGSIRQPAAYTNLVGLKPTYGLVSRFGGISFASSFDQIGPMTLTVEDNALLLEAIASYDEKDSTSLDDVSYDFSSKIGESIEGLKIALPKELNSDVVDETIRQAVNEAVEFYRSQGAIVEEVSIPFAEHVARLYEILAYGEASTSLQRYDGLRYGYRSPEAQNLEEVYVKSRTEGFGEEVKTRMMLGTASIIQRNKESFYHKAAKIRTLLIEQVMGLFEDYDLILTPTTAMTAPRLGETVDEQKADMNDNLAIVANLVGIPALSFPAGMDNAGMPVGIQLMAKPLNEKTIYQAAHAYESNTDFTSQAPTL